VKKFVHKIALFFLLPAFCWALIEALLPVTLFTHRPWEAVFFAANVPSSTLAYKNLKIEMEAAGDLCHHRKNGKTRRQKWHTDKLGFRNNRFVEKADVLFIGDSFVAGCHLDQEEIISKRLEKKFANLVKAYNMAPCLFSTADEYFKKGIIKKPKVIVFSCVERIPPPKMVLYEGRVDSQPSFAVWDFWEAGGVNMYLDRGLRHFSINWMRSRLRESKGAGIKGTSEMYFLEGKVSRAGEKELIRTADVIIGYKNYCDARGIQFIFLPIPNKESVYFERVPFESRPDFLFSLDSILLTAKVNTVNSLKIFSDFRKTNANLLYYLDDSHWNVTGVEVLLNELVKNPIFNEIGRKR
jgi:alginate O-acetyltransferase complex protein AlgJ